VKPPDVVVFDRQRISAQAFTSALSERFRCAEAVSSLEHLAATVAALSPLVVVLSLGGCESGVLARALSVLGTTFVENIVVLTEPLNRALAEAAMQAGVAALVLANGDLLELQFAIDMVKEHRHYVSPQVAASAASPLRKPERPLTRRQQIVMQLRRQGLTMSEIARRLQQDVKNVEKRLQAGKQKFGAAPGETLDFSTLDLG
jgi:DNA-binding NarL/FixJ family response regulator